MQKTIWRFTVTLFFVLSLCGCTGKDENAIPATGTAIETALPAGKGTAQNSNGTSIPDPSPTSSPLADSASINTESIKAIPEDSYFEVHYLDVGQADAALVLCDGASMLIDGGNKADSSLIYSYLKEHDISHLDYIVCTHAQEDHAGGLAGALNYATVDVAFCPVTRADNAAFNDFVKYLDLQGVSITEPVAGETFQLGHAEIKILGPLSIDEDEPNNTSIVLRIEYGATSFLFTGDAEREEEQEILDAGYSLQSTVLKVGHHGSASSTIYPFLREVMPLYAVISVGKENLYGHPTDEVLSRLHDADVKVFRTDMLGTVIGKSDGKIVDFTVEKNPDADTFATSVQKPETITPVTTISGGADTSVQPALGTDYVLNINTHKFHYPSCASVKKMKDKNKQFFTGTREEVLAMGYSPCGNCHP